jgi:molybdopterin-guanine dinucleotide biosynthesis protein A
MAPFIPPIGVLLAGGRGRRMGGHKATIGLLGQPLLHHPLAALSAVLDEVVVVAKGDTDLPQLAGLASVWVEPAGLHHPLSGIVHALRCAAGRPVLVVAGDLALLDPDTVRRIASADPQGALAVVPRAAGHLQPLCALYLPGAVHKLAAFDPDRRVTEVVEEIGIQVVDYADPTPFFNVNTPDDLLQATAMLDRRERGARMRPPSRT